jgi:hypothetical protein
MKRAFLITFGFCSILSQAQAITYDFEQCYLLDFEQIDRAGIPARVDFVKDHGLSDSQISFYRAELGDHKAMITVAKGGIAYSAADLRARTDFYSGASPVVSPYDTEARNMFRIDIQNPRSSFRQGLDITTSDSLGQRLKSSRSDEESFEMLNFYGPGVNYSTDEDFLDLTGPAEFFEAGVFCHAALIG